MNVMLLMTILPTLLLPWIVKLCFPDKTSWGVQGIALLIGVGLSAIVFMMGVSGQTTDYELWNGSVIDKSRVHGTYVESYSCNCRTVSSGSGKNQTTSTQCDTCYRDHYTVKWTAFSDIGQFNIQTLDELSKRVYATPDPARYIEINKGDPVCKKHEFVNYVKAVPESLFHANQTNTFDKMIPDYPINVYDIYKVNRAIAVGVSVPDLDKWNADISNVLRVLGPNRQANVIVLFVNTANESYLHALEGKWIGGKKNDIIVIIGTTAYPKIDWVAISSWTDRSLFKVQLRDDIMSLGNIDREKIIQAIQVNTLKTFERKHMKDFQYLDDAIVPDTWVLIFAVVLGIIASLVTSYVYYRSELSYKRRW